VKIAVEARYLLTREKTGVENYTYGLLAAIARLEGDQELQLYLHRRPRSQEFDLLQPFLISPRSIFHIVPPLKLWLKIWLPLAMRRRRADIALFPGSILPWLNLIPAVMLVYDLCWATYPECYPAREIAIFRDIYPRSLRAAKLVIAISEATKKEISRVYGTPEAKIKVIPSGVDPVFAPVAKAAEAVSRDWQLSPGYILAVGTAHPRKNIAALLRAYAQLPVSGRPPLALTGPAGPTTDPLAHLAEELGVGQQIRWLGYVKTEDLPALYSAAGVFVMPSLYEGFGMPVLEAMACGAPVICSNTTAFPEVAGEAGLLIDPTKPEALAGALQKVLNNPELAEEMRQKGWQQAAHFSWERSGHLALKYLQEACGG
jgi:glycosyltransferase involved in cell wall biosynthesis